MLCVGWTEWRWLNPERIKTGHYFRMHLLVLMFNKINPPVRWNGAHYRSFFQREMLSENEGSTDAEYYEDEGEYEEDETDSEQDYERVSVDRSGARYAVPDGKHCYPAAAQNPETVWALVDSDPNVWHIMSGPSRPGYWIKTIPCITIRPAIHDKNRWRIRNVKPLHESVRGGGIQSSNRITNPL